MLRSVVFVWVLFSTSAVAQFGTHTAPPSSVCSSTPGLAGCPSTTTKSSKTSDATDARTASTTKATAGNGGGGGGTGTVTQGTASSTIQPSTLAATASSGAVNDGEQPSTKHGMTSSEKIGIGVGVGVGGALIIGAVALFFILRRRKANNRYGSANSSAAQLRDQPAMSSAAPALAGVSAIGHSSKHSLPQTPSQHSLADVPAPAPVAAPPAPTIQPPSQHSLARAPSQLSVAPSLPEQESLMAPPPPYEDRPSPLEEDPEPVSPISPISEMGSRPPSPINEHDRL